MTSRSNNKPQGRFFALKHVGLFTCMALLILVVDIFLYIAIALFEANASYYEGTDPNSTQSEGRVHVSDVADSLRQDDEGTWILDDNEIEQSLLAKNAWALLINEKGEVEWNFNTPSDFPSSFTQNEIAVLSHDRAYSGYVTFIWTKNSDLVIMGYPDSQYVFFGIMLSSQAFLRIPLYFLMIFTIDLLIMFLLYALSQRSLLKNTGPMLDALDNLAQGKPAKVRFGGMLRVVGNRINAVSDTLLRKETARKNWVAGVSHDVRTPLAVAMGHAERIENDATLPENTRESAAIITRQGVRIRDLIEDLNITTQLEYDMQPLKIDTIVLAKLLRSVVADYLNQGMDDHADFDLDIAEAAAHLSISGDERLLKRALRNAVDNSLKHNPDHCHITISLNVNEKGLALCVADDGRGMNKEQLFALAVMLERDYLGIGSLAAHTETSITFSKTHSFVPNEQKEGGPELPPDNTSQIYEIEAPIISSQKKPMGSNADNFPYSSGSSWEFSSIPAKKRPPAPPIFSSEESDPKMPSGSGAHYVPVTPSNPDMTSCPTVPLDGTTHSGSDATNPDEHYFTQNRFVTGTNKTTPIPHGGSIGKHGLGLPLIARIVLVHEGTLTIASAEGEGFSIIMTFPLA